MVSTHSHIRAHGDAALRHQVVDRYKLPIDD